jgi:hypothetical protein
MRKPASDLYGGATKKLLRFLDRYKLLFLRAVLAQAVQSIMGATDTFLSKVSGLAPVLKSGYLLIAAILPQIPANYTYAAAPASPEIADSIAVLCRNLVYAHNIRP